MRRWHTTVALSGVLALALWGQETKVSEGRILYQRHCAACHGANGRGDGPMSKFIYPSPTNLTKGVFKFRSTPTGTLPTDDDLKRVISEGIQSTPMFGMKGILTESEIDALVAYIKTLSPSFQEGDKGEPIKVNPMPPSPELVSEGRKLYFELGCDSCHGKSGQGDGPAAKSLQDEKGRPIRILSFADAHNFKAGFSPTDIYRTIMTGLDGSPMPSFAEMLSEREGWALAYFVHSLIQNKVAPKRFGDQIPVSRLNKLPLKPDDASWKSVPVVNLALQPTWDRVRSPEFLQVQLATDGQNLVLRLQWSDEKRDVSTKGQSDAVFVQLPLDADKPIPSLFYGDPKSPVKILRWDAGKGLTVYSAKGFGTLSQIPDANVQGSGQWLKNRWVVVFSVKGLNLSSPLPVSFSVWNGSLGDIGERRLMTGWHFLVTQNP